MSESLYEEARDIDTKDLSPEQAVVIPTSGVVVNLDNEREVAIAYRDVKQIRDELTRIDRLLREAMAARKKILGTGTFYLEGVGKVEVKGDTETEWDIVALETGLRDVGCPKEIIKEIVKPVTTYKVDAARANRAAKANPDYARVIEDAKIIREKLPSVSVT